MIASKLLIVGCCFRVNKTKEYFLLGCLFGALFPSVATVFDLVVQGAPVTFANAKQVQFSQPLHWIIDTAPLFLGVLAGFAGRRQDIVVSQIQELTVLNERLHAESLERERVQKELEDTLLSEQAARVWAEEEHRAGVALASNLDTLFEKMPVGAAAYGPDGDLISANAAFELFIGGQEKIQTALERQLAQSSFSESLAREITVDVDGTVRHALIAHVNLSGISTTSYWLLLVDLTALKDKETQLLQASKLASLGELATGTAHELNQPLNHIRLLAANISNLLKRLSSDDNVVLIHSKVEAVVGSVDRAASIINQMREFGRNAPTELSSVSVKDAVKGALTLLESELLLQGVRIDIVIPDDVPRVLAQQTKLEQVFINLLSNSRDAIATTQSSEPRIFIEAVRREQTLVVTVRDTGGGFDDIAREKIFEPFFTTKELGQGTGIGGSISYGIIKSFGGDLTAGNWERGAEIAITLLVAESN